MGIFGRKSKQRGDEPINYGQGVPVFDGSPITVQDKQGNDYTYTPGEWDSSRLNKFRNFSEYARQQALEAKLAEAAARSNPYYQRAANNALPVPNFAPPSGTPQRYDFPNIPLDTSYNGIPDWRNRMPSGMPSTKFAIPAAAPAPVTNAPAESNAALSYSDNESYAPQTLSGAGVVEPQIAIEDVPHSYVDEETAALMDGQPIIDEETAAKMEAQKIIAGTRNPMEAKLAYQQLAAGGFLPLFERPTAPQKPYTPASIFQTINSRAGASDYLAQQKGLRGW